MATKDEIAPAEPLWLIAARAESAERGIALEELLNEDEHELDLTDFPSPACLSPYEAENLLSSNVVDASGKILQSSPDFMFARAVNHLRSCEFCQCVVTATRPSMARRAAFSRILDEAISPEPPDVANDHIAGSSTLPAPVMANMSLREEGTRAEREQSSAERWEAVSAVPIVLAVAFTAVAYFSPYKFGFWTVATLDNLRDQFIIGLAATCVALFLIRTPWTRVPTSISHYVVAAAVGLGALLMIAENLKEWWSVRHDFTAAIEKTRRIAGASIAEFEQEGKFRAIDESAGEPNVRTVDLEHDRAIYRIEPGDAPGKVLLKVSPVKAEMVWEINRAKGRPAEVVAGRLRRSGRDTCVFEANDGSSLPVGESVAQQCTSLQGTRLLGFVPYPDDARRVDTVSPLRPTFAKK